jgi:uncharacterized protein
VRTTLFTNSPRHAAVKQVNDLFGVTLRWPLPLRRGMPGWLRRLLLGLLLLGLAHPASAQITFEQTALAIESGAGTLTFQVELAVTPEQRQQGLMFRESLESDQGMLFDFGRSAPVTMWMRNTFVPLDMLFIDAEGRIARIVADTEPLSDATIGSGGPVRAVLELRAGTSEELGITVGDHVVHPIFAAP